MADIRVKAALHALTDVFPRTSFEELQRVYETPKSSSDELTHAEVVDLVARIIFDEDSTSTWAEKAKRAVKEARYGTREEQEWGRGRVRQRRSEEEEEQEGDWLTILAEKTGQREDEPSTREAATEAEKAHALAESTESAISIDRLRALYEDPATPEQERVFLALVLLHLGHVLFPAEEQPRFLQTKAKRKAAYADFKTFHSLSGASGSCPTCRQLARAMSGGGIKLSEEDVRYLVDDYAERIAARAVGTRKLKSAVAGRGPTLRQFLREK